MPQYCKAPEYCKAPAKSPGGGSPAWYTTSEGGPRCPLPPNDKRLFAHVIAVGYDNGEVWDRIVEHSTGSPWRPREHAQQDA